MGFLKLDERTVLVESYEQVPVFTDKPEPTKAELERERKADRTTGTDLRRMLGGWTPDQLDAAISSRGFPRPIAHRESGWTRPQREPIYSFKQVAAWLEREREFQATLPKELKR